MAKKSLEQQCTEFVRLAYCGLVLRGCDSAAETNDPILEEVWRLGRKVVLAEKRKGTKENSDG